MSASESDVENDADTVEHLLGIVVENREKRCAELREKACQEAREIIKQAHARSRARLHRHIDALREKYRVRVSSAHAHNQTLLRQQHQKTDRAILDIAWPVLRKAMLALWKDPDSRRKWLHAAIASAVSRLREHGGRIEHPLIMSEEELKWMKQQFPHNIGKKPDFAACDDLEAGIRIIADGTVMDASLEGLLKQKTSIEATMIARVKQEADCRE
jgi:hypothetical protein